jgi:hypothetical protein
MFENTNAVWPGIKTDGRPVWQQTLIILTILDCRMDCRRCLNHEILFFEQLKLPVFILIGAGVEEILLYTILITAMIALHHGNIAIPDRIDNILRSVIATPLPHRISTPLCETSMTQSLKTYILYGAAFPRISF